MGKACSPHAEVPTEAEKDQGHGETRGAADKPRTQEAHSDMSTPSFIDTESQTDGILLIPMRGRGTPLYHPPLPCLSFDLSSNHLTVTTSNHL